MEHPEKKWRDRNWMVGGVRIGSGGQVLKIYREQGFKINGNVSNRKSFKIDVHTLLVSQSTSTMVDSSIPTLDTPSRPAQASRNVSIQSLASSNITSATMFVAEVVIFLLLRRRFTAL